jgi:hypothetical protein
MIPKVTSLFEYGPAFNRRQPINDYTQRLTTSVHVDRGDVRPVFGWSPIYEMVHQGGILATKRHKMHKTCS